MIKSFKDFDNELKGQKIYESFDDKKKQMIKAKDEESSEDVVIKAQLAAVNIYNLLEEVAHGSQSLRVRVINNNSGGANGTGSVGGQNAPLNENTGDGITSAGTGAGKYGADNGNWVLSF